MHTVDQILNYRLGNSISELKLAMASHRPLLERFDQYHTVRVSMRENMSEIQFDNNDNDTNLLLQQKRLKICR